MVDVMVCICVVYVLYMCVCSDVVEAQFRACGAYSALCFAVDLWYL